MYTAAKLLILLLSLAGYAALYQKRRLPSCFFPVTFISGAASVMYLLGLAGLLKIGTYAVLAGGIAALAWCRGFRGWREFLADGSIFFTLIGVCWLFFITRDVMLSHWDDGSHWYRVCKSIFYEHAFPTTSDILYYDYVPGCQTWVYFILRFVGFSIPNCLFAQGIINVSCVAALFAGTREMNDLFKKVVSIVIICFAGVTLCSMTVGTYSLVVDLQLGLVAMAAMIFALDQSESGESVYQLMPMLIFLAIIKNSGIFFVLAVAYFAIRSSRRHKRGTLRTAVCCLGAPVLAYALYSVRTALVYGNPNGGPQGLSAERFMGLLGAKDADTILAITKLFFERLFIGDTGLSAAVYLCILLLVILWFELREEKKAEPAGKVFRFLTGGLVILALYAVMLYMTYLMAMEVSEAIVLNSFYRYFGSCVILFAGATLYTAMSNLTQLPVSKHRLMIWILLMVVVGMPSAYSKKYILGHNYFVIQEDFHDSVWNAMKYFMPQAKHHTDERYAVVWDAEDFFGNCLMNERFAYNAGAWLRCDDPLAISQEDLEEGLDEETAKRLQASDYVVLLSDMSEDKELLSRYVDMADFAGGTYRLEDGRYIPLAL